MQQQQSMIHAMPSHPSTNISTEQIQKYLDENRRLILAILDNQNLGKLAECAKYQAVLQKNLMYLAAIADAQPPQAQTPAMPPQMAAHPQMQQGGYYMQHPQTAAVMAQQQSGLFPQKVLMQYSSPHQLQDPQMHHQHQQHQAIQSQMSGGFRPNNGLHHAMQQHAEPGNKHDNTSGDGLTDHHHHGQGSSAVDGSEEAN